ncbi:Uncharacterised protein [uncultured archaeon]|nr:Uncharacterised protein [uncultured archaeon]
MKTHALALLALILLVQLAPILHADSTTFVTEEGGKFEARFNNWVPIAITAIMLCLFANILVYMLGVVLQAENLKRYAMSEFLQVTASALIIFFAVELVYSMQTGSGLDFMVQQLGTGSTVDCAAAQGGKFQLWNENGDFGRGPLGAFKCKVQEKITALDVSYNNLVTADKWPEVRNSICYSIFGVPIYCYDWNQEMHNEVEMAHYVATKIVSLLIPLHAQYVLADYIQKNMLTIFLPLGLVLRILPFTRGVGGLFIAIAVGFFFIWPTFFLLTDPTFVKADQPLKDVIAGQCFTGFSGSAVLLAGTFSGGTPPAVGLATAQGADLVYQLTIATMFYPFVALVITLVFIRAMTPLLGGDMGELMRMVGRLG